VNLDSRLRWALFCVLLGAYLLVYIPQPDSADGEAVLAVAGAFVRTGSVDMGAATYTDWLIPPAGRLGSPGLDGATYAKKGVTPSLALLPFVAAAELLPWLSMRATAMLLNPVVTALTGVLIYTLARRLGFRPRTAFVTGLLYGLATFAIVYTKTLFGEPLAALLLTVCALHIHRLWADGRWGDAAVTGASLGLLVGVNTVYAAIIPVIGLAVLYGLLRWGLKPTRLLADSRALKPGLAFALPLALVLVVLGLYNAARFGSPFSSGYHFGAGEGFSNPILFGLYGLFLSPFRGLFPYSPILLLALPGWWMLLTNQPQLPLPHEQSINLNRQRLKPPAAKKPSPLKGLEDRNNSYSVPLVDLSVRQPEVLTSGGKISSQAHPRPFALLLLALVALQGVLFAAWWSWHGGIVWGPRFLVPAVPLLALCLAPVIEAAFKQRWLMLVIIGLTAVSFIVQMLGALYSYYPYIGQLYAEHSAATLDSVGNQFAPEVYTDPALSAIGGHAQRALAGAPLEPAWIANGIDWPHLLATLSLIAVGIIGLLPLFPFTWERGLRVALALLALNIVAARHPDPRMEAMQAALQPPAAVVAATTGFGSGWLDIETRAPVITINAPTTPDDTMASRLWDFALRREGLLWFVTWFSPGDPANWQERELWQRAYFTHETIVEGHRALLFDIADTPIPDQAGGWRFGDIQLEEYGVAFEDGRARAALAWAVDAPLRADYGMFAHLLDTNGAIIAQHDRAPGGGYVPPSGWQPDEIHIERLAFLIPDGMTAVQLRVGFVDPATGEQRPAFAPDGAPLPDGFALLPLQ
jgi:hypothetical protein